MRFTYESERVQKLLALANDKSNTYEARAALRRAYKLLTGLTSSNVSIVKVSYNTSFSAIIGSVCARLYDSVCHTDLAKKKMVIIGDTDKVVDVWQHFITLVVLAAKRVFDKKSEQLLFCDGFACRLLYRIDYNNVDIAPTRKMVRRKHYAFILGERYADRMNLDG